MSPEILGVWKYTLGAPFILAGFMEVATAQLCNDYIGICTVYDYGACIGLCTRVER
jgi:hypothetical protein